MALYSILDLSPVLEGGNASQAFRNTVDLAQHAEGWGYHRYWLAEHHNMAGIASAATSVVIGHVAGATRRIRVGSGGVMLPNHAPLVIAEQFGTLESLYPGRIDLGLGRAPGTDQLTARALRRTLGSSGETFPDDVLELQSYFRAKNGGRREVHAVPGHGLDVPLYLLGSSDFTARLAAELGISFAFASHFAPDNLHVAIELYRRGFKPSASLLKPHLIVGIGLYVAESDAEARRIFTSAQQSTLKLTRGFPGLLPPSVESMDGRWTPGEEAAIRHRSSYSAVGSPATVQQRLREIIEETGADELIAVAQIHDHQARLRSYELGAEIFRSLLSPRQPRMARRS